MAFDRGEAAGYIRNAVLEPKRGRTRMHISLPKIKAEGGQVKVRSALERGMPSYLIST